MIKQVRKHYGKFTYIILIQMIILVMIAFSFMRDPINYKITANQLVTLDERVAWDEKSSTYVIYNEEKEEIKKVLESDEFTLYPGAYEIDVKYTILPTENPGDINNHLGCVQLESRQDNRRLTHSAMETLIDGSNLSNQREWLYGVGKLNDIKLNICFSGGDFYKYRKLEL